MGLALVSFDSPVARAVLGAPGLKLQGGKPLLRSVALALRVSSLPVQP